MRNLRAIALEQYLIEPGRVIERAESGLQPLNRVIAPSVVEALVVDAADMKRTTEVAGLRQETVLIPEAVQIDLRGERSGFLPILRNIASPEHGGSLRRSR
jgi:hypothetical protein